VSDAAAPMFVDELRYFEHGDGLHPKDPFQLLIDQNLALVHGVLKEPPVLSITAPSGHDLLCPDWRISSLSAYIQTVSARRLKRSNVFLRELCGDGLHRLGKGGPRSAFVGRELTEY
jgi:hypothetical protein